MAKFLRIPRRGARVEWRIFFVALIMLAGFSALIGKLWWEQVARGDHWAKKVAGRSQVKVRIPSVRGEIRDRNGVTLVTNRASYGVEFYLRDMVRGFRDQYGAVPTTKYKGTVRGMLTEKTEADIVQIVNTSIIPRLQELDLAKDYNTARLIKHYRNDTEVPFTYLEELDFPTIAKFSEHDVGLPGVQIGKRPVRQYIYGALGAHMLGYVGAPNRIDELPDVRDYNFYQPDVEGKSEVEKALDEYIRGTPGVSILQRNVKGVIEGEVENKPAKQGNNVYLTIDAKIQYIAERALRKVGRGAAVVVNPNNGDILAMASVPSYDPNVFIPSVTHADWDKLNQDDTDPLTNRAILSYAPGSTYKVVSGLAGLYGGLAARRNFHCSGGVQYGAKYMRCWIADKGGSHGSIGLSDALKVSCNAFFYQWGNAAKIDNIVEVGTMLGLGQRAGVPLSNESPGILPGPEWLKLISPTERWSDGYTANVSIGQGSVEASPLQMAMVTATIANRGISYQPRLIHKILDQNGKDVRDEDGKLVAPPEPKIRANLQELGVKDEQIELIRRGLWKVVNEGGGTGKRAQIKGVEVAGKTGTAQFWRESKGKRIKDNHTWFIAFAPYNEPKYAIAVFVQGAKSGGGVSAPIAQKILEESLSLEKGYDPGLAKLEPAPGSFAHIEQVDYTKTDPLPDLGGDDETADHTEAPVVKKREKQVRARPDIRAEADQRGRVTNRRVERAVPVEKRRGFFDRFLRPRENNPRPPTKPFRQGGR